MLFIRYVLYQIKLSIGLFLKRHREGYGLYKRVAEIKAKPHWFQNSNGRSYMLSPFEYDRAFLKDLEDAGLTVTELKEGGVEVRRDGKLYNPSIGA